VRCGSEASRTRASFLRMSSKSCCPAVAMLPSAPHTSPSLRIFTATGVCCRNASRTVPKAPLPRCLLNFTSFSSTMSRSWSSRTVLLRMSCSDGRALSMTGVELLVAAVPLHLMAPVDPKQTRVPRVSRSRTATRCAVCSPTKANPQTSPDACENLFSLSTNASQSQQCQQPWEVSGCDDKVLTKSLVGRQGSSSAPC
jgi:hypothetical protein